MRSIRYFVFSVLIFVLFSAVGHAAELQAGSRVVIKAEGRADYSPRIVGCSAPSGICLRDTRYDPPDNPIEIVNDGQRVKFPSWKIAYVFHPNGSGSVLDGGNKKIGSFKWSQ